MSLQSWSAAGANSAICGVTEQGGLSAYLNINCTIWPWVTSFFQRGGRLMTHRK